MQDETGGETPDTVEASDVADNAPEAPVEDAEEPANDAEGSGE